MASGDVKGRANRPDTWQLRPAGQTDQKTLANGGPSTHGAFPPVALAIL